MINWAVLYLKRLERFSQCALISTISKINISIIIANIAKRYRTFMFISIPFSYVRCRNSRGTPCVYTYFLCVYFMILKYRLSYLKNVKYF